MTTWAAVQGRRYSHPQGVAGPHGAHSVRDQDGHRQRSDVSITRLISARWKVSAVVPPPIASGRRALRQETPRTACLGPRTPLSYYQVPRQANLMPREPAPLSWRRRSRYLPVARRFAVAHVAHVARHCGGSADFSRPGRPWLSWDAILSRTHPSMPRERGAHGMLSTFAFPIGSRHPDLAPPQQSRSIPLPAPAVMRFDHAKQPFQYCRDSGGFQRSFFYPCYPVFAATRDRLHAPAPGAGFCAHLQIDPLATYPGAHFSRAGQALGAGDRLARRRYPPLDCSAGTVGVMDAARPERAPIPARVAPAVADTASRLMRKSRTFPGEFAWQRAHRRSTIRADDGR